MTWERELKVLEEAIRRLNAEYDAFLYGSGSAAKPPIESRKHVEQMIRRLSAASLEDAAESYRFSTLQGRFSALVERWDRLQGEKEAGRRPGLYGHFVPESVRASHSDGGTVPKGAGAPNAEAAASVGSSKGSAESDRELFETYRNARRARGESVEGYVYEKFAESLERERARLSEKLGTGDVVFEVAERDGKVKLIARRGEGPSGGAALSGEKK